MSACSKFIEAAAFAQEYLLAATQKFSIFVFPYQFAPFSFSSGLGKSTTAGRILFLVLHLLLPPPLNYPAICWSYSIIWVIRLQEHSELDFVIFVLRFSDWSFPMDPPLIINGLFDGILFFYFPLANSDFHLTLPPLTQQFLAVFCLPQANSMNPQDYSGKFIFSF